MLAPNMTKKLILSTLTALAAAFTLAAADAPATNAAPAKPAARAAARPFNATIKSIDQVAKTVALMGQKEQVLQITSETIIKKDAKPATFEDLRVGDRIVGTLREAADGKLDAATINDGLPPKAKKPAAATPPAGQ